MKITGNEPIHPIDCKIDILSKDWANGLTIHQYYTGLAMQGLLINPETNGKLFFEIANNAIKCADALIEELNKTKK